METQITEGSLVWIQGHQFIATNVTFETIRRPWGDLLVAYFDGTCTAHKCNDSIRATAYNGGRYSRPVLSEVK